MESKLSNIPYREKLAWLLLFAMTLTFGPYFVYAANYAPFGEASQNIRPLGPFAIAAIIQVLIIGAGYLFLFTKSPAEAKTPPDERDQAIMQRAIKSAYYVLIAGMILVGCVMPFNSSGWKIINAAIFMIAIAQVVHYAVTIYGYRKQA